MAENIGSSGGLPSASAAKLAADLHCVVRDAEELIRATAGEVAEKTRLVRERLASTLAMAKETLTLLEQQAIAGARATDTFVRENPYRAIAAAAGIGFLAGYILTRGDDYDSE